MSLLKKVETLCRVEGVAPRDPPSSYTYLSSAER